MDARDLAARVVLVAEEFNSANRSMVDLVSRAGYVEHHATVTEQHLRDALAEHPSAVDAWMQSSADKRSSGWYVMQRGPIFVLQHLNEQYSVDNEIEVSDRLDAVAAFVKRELEDIRTIAVADSKER